MNKMKGLDKIYISKKEFVVFYYTPVETNVAQFCMEIYWLIQQINMQKIRAVRHEILLRD
jgi:hypothetical protein